MEFLLNRFRNLTVLLIVVLAQLLLLAYQVKSSQDIRLIRVWAVTAVTPIAKVLELVRRNTIGIVEDYFVLINVREENRRLSDELGKMKMENHFLKSELQTAERAQALSVFQARTPSRTVPARIIGTGTGANSRVVYVDRGTGDGIMRGMAVVTPEGIVGKVLDSFPTASQVLLITDQSFAAGVISQKNRVHGTIRGQGQSKCIVDYVQNEEKVEVGEMFYTSGDDRIFPKGMPVGRATVVRTGKNFKEIYVVPSGFQNGVEEVLIVVQGEHQSIPQLTESAAAGDVYLMDRPKATGANPAVPNVLVTDADRMRERYKEVGDAQGHDFGEGGPGSRPPNFNLRVEAPKPSKPAVPQNPQTNPTPSGTGSAQTSPAQVPAVPKPRAPVVLGADGQPIVSPPKAAATGSGQATSAATGTNQTPAPPKPRPPAVGPDGQPVATQAKPTTATGQSVSGQSATGVIPTTLPPKPKPPAVGPDGQPVATQPKPTTTSGQSASGVTPTTTPPKPRAVVIGPDGQPLAVQPRVTTTTTGQSSTGIAGSQTTPPAKPRPPAVGPDGQPLATQPKPTQTKPAGTIEGNTTAGAPAATPAKPKSNPADNTSGTSRSRVMSNDTNNNVATPNPPRTATPKPPPAKPKPESSEAPPNP